jgi:hypothetical protein
MPIRIQRKRTKGWRMPPNTVYVGRGTPWGNPFRIGTDGTAQECVEKFVNKLIPYRHRGPHNTLADYLESDALLRAIELRLRGKNLACWCPLDQPCHADVLLEIANQPTD